MISKTLLAPFFLFSLILVSAEANAGIFDDVIAWFTGGDETEQQAPQQTMEEAESVTENKSTGSLTNTAVSAAEGLLPLVTQQLGVTDAQAKAGLGAIFLASKKTLSAENYQLIADAVPNINSYIAAAPPLNKLVSGTMSMLGGSDKTAAAANLLGQFNDIGLDPSMITAFSQQTVNYLRSTSPEASAALTEVVGRYLE